jgi:predicted RNase H-like nuclease (RuvC/YqgF family)
MDKVMNKYIKEFKEAINKLEEAEDYLYSNSDIAALKKENENLKKELEEYKQVNKYLQDDKEYAKQAYINKLSNAIKKNYEDYKKYAQLADKEQIEILIDNLYDTLRDNGIKLD